MSDLRATLVEIEEQCSKAGWQRGVVLYALVPTADLLESAPEMATALAEKAPDSLTAIEQDPIELESTIEEFLATLAWGPEVFGAALVLERVIVTQEPPSELSGSELDRWLSSHGQEVRLAVAVLRDGQRECAMRLRDYDNAASVMVGKDLLPGMADSLALTFAD